MCDLKEEEQNGEKEQIYKREKHSHCYSQNALVRVSLVIPKLQFGASPDKILSDYFTIYF